MCEVYSVRCADICCGKKTFSLSVEVSSSGGLNNVKQTSSSPAPFVRAERSSFAISFSVRRRSHVHNVFALFIDMMNLTEWELNHTLQDAQRDQTTSFQGLKVPQNGMQFVDWILFLFFLFDVCVKLSNIFSFRAGLIIFMDTCESPVEYWWHGRLWL